MADEALKEEAKAKAREEAQEKIDEALSCSCIDDLKEGPCGAPFVEAFGCFVKSQQPIFEGETDCTVGFAKLKECMVKHPEQFEDFAKAFEKQS